VDTTTAKPRYCVEAIGGSDFWSSRRGAQSTAPGNGALQRDELEMTQGYFVPQTGGLHHHQIPAKL